MTDAPEPPTPQDAGSRPAARAAGSTGQQTMWPEDYTPSRADYICLTLIAVSGIYGLVVMFARPWLLQLNPLLLAGLSGSRSALVTIGALHATQAASQTVVIVAFVISSISAIKLDLLFWWAGRLWGSFFVDSLVGDSPRKARQAVRAEKLARRYSISAIVLSNIPVLPIPRSLVFAILGVSGASFRKVFVVDLAASAVVQATWLYLGYRIGQPVVEIVELIARYALWISLAMLVVVMFTAMRKARRQAAAEGEAPGSAEVPGEPTR